MTQTQPTTHTGSSTGQMTAVMRAMNQATGPKVLRVGVVQGGKVIEERIIKQRTHVTIGPSEKSMFVTPSKNIPPSFRLFELVGNEYALNFLEGMSGRVALKTGVSDLASLKSQAKKIALGNTQTFQVTLSDDESRGKIVVGETTFLFQFVAAPPPQPKVQLPVSVRGGLIQSIDWTTTIIAAFSFLLHFGAVGTIYSDWMDPPVNDEVDVAQILESVRSLPPPPPVEQPKEQVDQAAPTSTAAAETPKPSGASAAKSPGGKISDTRAAAIANELQQLDMQMLGALNAAGNATAGVLDRGDVPLGLLDNAAASGAGAGLGGIAGLNINGAGGGTVRPGSAGGGGLAQIGDTQAAAAASSQGAAKTVKGPTGSANVGGAAVSGGNVANASSVVAGMAAGFRRCYNRGLQNDPTMKGSVRITAKIGPNGEVLSASPSGGGGLGGDVISCVVARVQSAQFAPPEGGGATVVIPVSFVSQ